MKTTYFNRQKIMSLTGRKREWVRQFLRGMEASGRYPPDEIIKEGYTEMVSASAFYDWLMNRKKIEQGEWVAPYKRR